MKQMNLFDEIDNANDIFDFIVIIYKALIDKKHENKIITNHNRWVGTEDGRKAKMNLNKLVCMNISNFRDSFDAFKTSFKKIMCNYLENSDSFLLATLYSIDNYMNDYITNQKSDELRGKEQNIGPLNKNGRQKGMYLFFKPQKRLDEKILVQYGLRRQRTLRQNPINGIARDFKYIIILREAVLDSCKPKITKYFPPSEIGSVVKIGVVPFYNMQWWIKDVIYEEKTVNVKYNVDEELVNVAINECIDKSAGANIDILVFPELIVNKLTVETVKMHLLCSSMSQNNPKLIFLGSLWDNKKNVAYILSGTGKLIASINKNVPFDHYDKNVGGFITENLEDTESEILLLDVEGIGRISYFICKDGLEELFSNIAYTYLHANIDIISAYTERIGEFSNKANSKVTSHFAITVLANACAARVNDEIGFVMMPRSDKDKNFSSQSHVIRKHLVETCSDCKYCGCINVFSIDRELVLDDGSLSIEHEII